MKTKLLLTTLASALLVAPAAFAADNYKIDNVHSHVLFKIKHLNLGYQYGRFNQVAGNFVYDTKNPARSSVSLQIKTASIDSNNAQRDKHLNGPDFFSSKQFPSISFKSTQVKQLNANQFKVSGNLNLHGKTQPLSFTLTKTGEGKGMKGEHRLGAEATFTIKRSAFGMNYMQGPLSDEVTLIAAFEGVKQ